MEGVFWPAPQFQTHVSYSEAVRAELVEALCCASVSRAWSVLLPCKR